MQRLDLVAGDDHLDVGDIRNELRLGRARLRRRLEVAAHARPQRLRLSDVEHSAAVVAEQVDARALRKGLQCFLDFCRPFGHHLKRIAGYCAAPMRAALVLALALLALVACGPIGNGGDGSHKMFVGALDDLVKQPTPAETRQRVQQATAAGFDALGVTTPGHLARSTRIPASC